jgi:uncharacterized protein YfaS (alpha-2-macroglobulin family)
MDVDSTKEYHIHWKILDEDWYSWEINIKRPNNSYDSLIDQNNKNTTTFTAPQKGGPYRLYVEINQANGPYSYANIPFYIVK